MKHALSIKLQGRTTDVVFADKKESIGFHSDHSIVSDKNVVYQLPFYIKLLAALPPGEEAKSTHHLFAIITALLERSIDRNHILAGIGGGVVTDITAFAASVVLRGIPLVLIPTSLLAMVDAAIGGKTGINYNEYKNMVGTFYPAQEVRICLEYLTTLPDKEYISGLAEVIKAAIIGDNALLSTLEKNVKRIKKRDVALLKEAIILPAIQVKADIVQRDEREANIRKQLNLGHTFAHALETAHGLSAIRHGEAVAWGIRVATAYARKVGIVDLSHAQHIVHVLDLYGYATKQQVDSDRLIQTMHMDKKCHGNTIVLIVPQGRGGVSEVEMDEPLLREILPSFIY